MRTGQLQTLSRNGAHFSTLASHNPRLVRVGNNCFVSFNEEEHGRRNARLMRSNDGGRSFVTFDALMAGPNDYRPIGLVSDDEGLLAIYPEIGATDCAGGKQWFIRRYGPENDYSGAIFEKAMGPGGSNNFSTQFDPRRGVFYYATIIDSTPDTKRDNLFVVGRDGQICRQHAVTFSTGGSGFHYPHFAMREGTLFLAWTSWSKHENRYDGIAVMRSEDGGKSWGALDGGDFTLPVDGRPVGPADQLVVEEDRQAATWLADVCCHGDALHFFYCAQAPSGWRQRYLRYDLRSGKWTRVGPRWRGSTLEINGIDGFFLSTDRRLFAVGNQSGSAIAILVSKDLGITWEDFGIIPMPEGVFPYGLHGCLTEEGDIAGLFTACPVQPNVSRHSVMSFRITAH